ncbi:MAG: AAA family ATPase [Saprospiraceae bacterium]|nr:AAA family ATPase [Saprospiraceae bacterium]
MQRIDFFVFLKKNWPMSRFIKNLEIKNFKSIRQLNLSCGKINIVVGSPNVGKSNILEALSLLGAEYSKPEAPLLSAFIRYENLRNLFYDQNTRNPIEVNAKGVGCARMLYADEKQQYELVFGQNEAVVQELITSRGIDMALDSANTAYADAPGAVVLTALSTGVNRTRYQEKGAVVNEGAEDIA